MSMTKQTREYIALGVLLAVLVVAAVIFVRSNQPAPTRPRPQTTTSKPKPKSNDKPVTSSAVWVEKQQDRIPGLVAEVQGGRNPFQSLLMPVGPIGPTPGPSPNPEPRPGSPSGPLPGPDIIPPGPDAGLINVAQPVKLAWITRQDAAAALKKEGISDVTVSPGNKPGMAILSGPEMSVMDAQSLIAKLDVEPPPPDFQLRGVITTASSRFAVITVNGKTYSLYEGEKIPLLGWTVTRITPADVTLKKGRLKPVTRRLAGGNA